SADRRRRRARRGAPARVSPRGGAASRARPATSLAAELRPSPQTRKLAPMTETMRWFTRFLFSFVCLGSTIARAEEPRAVQRFAVVVGANDGGKARVHLRYAASDARTVAKVLSELGGVDRDDVAVVLQPTGTEFRTALRKAADRVAAAQARGERTHFVFYYSGHSDERGLMLGEEQVSYPELRKLLEEVPAQVRIGILDSCASGAFTRSKGGRRRAPFMVGGADVAGH